MVKRIRSTKKINGSTPKNRKHRSASKRKSKSNHVARPKRLIEFLKAQKQKHSIVRVGNSSIQVSLVTSNRIVWPKNLRHAELSRPK